MLLYLLFNNKEYNEESLLAYSKYWIEAQKRKKILNGNFGFFKTHNARVKINSNYYMQVAQLCMAIN